MGVLIGYINVLYLRPEFFQLSQIGIFTLITANAMIVSPLSSLGMGSSFIKFFPGLKKEDRPAFFTMLLVFVLIANALILLIGFSLKTWIAARYEETAPAYIQYLSITGIVVVSNSLFDLLFNYSRTIMRVVFPTFIRDIYLRVGSLLLVLGFALGWWSFNTAATGLGFVYLIAVVMLFGQLLTNHQLKLDFSFHFFNAKWRNQLFRFASYSMLLALSFAVINNITYEQITAQLGAELNGIYVTCFFIALVVEMPKRNMIKVMGPVISLEFERKNIPEVGKLYKRSSITLSVIGILLFIGIVTNLKDLFAFIPKGAAFQEGYWVVVGVCGVKLALMMSSFAGEIINFSNRYYYNLLYQLIIAVLLVTLNYLLLSIYGINGAVMSYCLAIFLHIAIKLGFVWKHFRIHPFMRSHAPLLLIGVLTGLLGYYFQPDIHPVLSIVIRSILVLIVYLILIYRFRISSDINRLIHSTFERFLHINLPT